MITETSLQEVIEGIRQEGPASDFAKKAFQEILDLMPAAPNIPGLEIFCALGSKLVPFFIDCLFIREENGQKQVLLTYRLPSPPLGGDA